MSLATLRYFANQVVITDFNLNDIMHEVSEETRVPINRIKGKNRSQEEIRARQLFVWLVGELTDKTQRNISEFLDRDGSSTYSYIKKAKKRYWDDIVFRGCCNRLKDRLS